MTYSVFIVMSSSLIYEVTNFSNFQLRHNSPVSPMPLPEETADDNMLVKIEGNSETITLTWMLTHTDSQVVGTTVSRQNGEYHITTDAVYNNINTPFAQLKFLRDYAPQTIADTHYHIIVIDNDISGSSSYNASTLLTASQGVIGLDKAGTIQSVTFNIDSSNPSNIGATLDFIVGTNIVSLSGDAPEAPVIQEVDDSVAGQLTITIKEAPYASAQDRPETTGAQMKANVDGVTRIYNIDLNPANQTVPYDLVFQNVVTGTYTQLKVLLKSDGIYGKWSTFVNADPVTSGAINVS